MYDKATSKFKEVELKEMHEVFKRAGLVREGEEEENKTIFTEKNPKNNQV
jgi:hypothetical protein